MHLRKKLIIVLLLTSFVVGLLHIGENNNMAEEETRRQSFSDIETVYLWYSDEAFTDYLTMAAVEFHSKNPLVRVIPTLVESGEYIEKINRASVDGKEFPDLYIITNDALEKAYLAGLASETRDKANVLNTNHFSQSALDAVTYNGSTIGYPLSFETSVLLYNKTYMEDYLQKVREGIVSESADDGGDMGEDYEGEEEVGMSLLEYKAAEVTLEDLIPKTFDDVKSFADVYDAPAGVEGVMKWSVSDIFFNYCFVGSSMIVGGDAGDDTGNIDIDNVNVINCLTIYQGLSQFFAIDAKDSDYQAVLDDFLDGKSVYTIVTSDAIAKVNEKIEERNEDIQAAFDKQEEYLTLAEEARKAGGDYEKYEALASEVKIPRVMEYGYTLIPDLTDGLASRSLSVTDTIVVNGYSEVKEAANEFAAFATTEYSPNVYARTGKLASSVDAGYEDEAFLTFQNEYADSIPLPKIVEASNLWVQLEITLAEIWGGADINTKIKEFAKQLSSQLGQ